MGNGIKMDKKEKVSPDGVKGTRSPNWAWWKRMLIPCKNGEDYLFRLRIFDTPLIGVYLHDIFEPDHDRDPHNHPWSFISIVLRGEYQERVYENPDGDLSDETGWEPYLRTRFSIHRMDTKSAHRIVYAAPKLKTLVIRGPRKPKGWGFFTRKGYVAWQDYVRFQEEG